MKKEKSGAAGSEKRLWINWESHRRSAVLAEHFRCDYREFVDRTLLRYPKAILGTLLVLLRNRPRTLFVQNPSMVLAVLAVLWKYVARCTVIVDRHSTFLIGREKDRRLALQVFRGMSSFSLRHADATIVTNGHLAQLVRDAGGNPFVLPDKLPHWPTKEVRKRKGGPRNVVVVSSFAPDEPIDAVIAAAEGLSSAEYQISITGRIDRAPQRYVENPPSCVAFTGYVSDADYVKLIGQADIVLVLTTAEYTMLCGCYEAVAAERALVTSDRQVLVKYFYSARFVDNSPAALLSAITMDEKELIALQKEIANLRVAISESWGAAAAEVEAFILGRQPDAE